MAKVIATTIARPRATDHFTDASLRRFDGAGDILWKAGYTNTMTETTAQCIADEDDQLIAAFASGQQDAARLLAERHLSRIYAVAFRMLGQQAEAEDVAQETMLRLWKMAASWEPGRAKLGTWLYRVACNLATDRLRARKFSRPAEDGEIEALIDLTPGVEQAMMDEQRDTALHRAIARLPERQKLAITLRHFEELSQQDMAVAMDTTVEAVESLLGRARRALAGMLAPMRRSPATAEATTGLTRMKARKR